MLKSTGLFFIATCSCVFSACSPKEISVNGIEDIEGDLSSAIMLVTDSAYNISFRKEGNRMQAETALKFEVVAARDYKEISMTAAILDSDDDPLCELVAKSESTLNRLVSAIRRGEGDVKVKFVSPANAKPLTDAAIENIINNGKSILVISSEGVLNKTPEQIKAEQDSLARATMKPLEITDFLDSKVSEPGFSGKLRNLKELNEVVSALEAKGFTLDRRYTKTVESYDDEMVREECADLSRNVGSNTETVVIREFPDAFIEIEFCDNDATTEFMGKMTMDGYRNGVSSDCYYAGSRVVRSGKKVTLSQIWEP